MGRYWTLGGGIKMTKRRCLTVNNFIENITIGENGYVFGGNPDTHLICPCKEVFCHKKCIWFHTEEINIFGQKTFWQVACRGYNIGRLKHK